MCKFPPFPLSQLPKNRFQLSVPILCSYATSSSSLVLFPILSHHVTCWWWSCNNDDCKLSATELSKLSEEFSSARAEQKISLIRREAKLTILVSVYKLRPFPSSLRDIHILCFAIASHPPLDKSVMHGMRRSLDLWPFVRSFPVP